MRFDYDSDPLDGLCIENQKIYKTDVACAVLEEMAQTAPLEIQQQMQDNIKWISAQENKLSGSSPNIC
jgi:urocanate hydratase